MKPFQLFIFCIIILACCNRKDNFNGIVIDQDGKPVKDVSIKVFTINDNILPINSDKKGRFHFFDSSYNDHYYSLYFEKAGYLSKKLDLNFYKYNIDSLNNITVVLRNRSSVIIDTTLITENDLGIKIKDAIIKYKLDIQEMKIQEEPLGVFRGIETELSDSTILYLQFPRNECLDRDSLDLMNQVITGIGLINKNCDIKYFGKDFVWWGLTNPYCKKKE